MAVATNPILGMLSWNLPTTLSYRAGTPITVIIRVTNITDTSREYQLQTRLERAGTTIYGPYILLVDGKEWFSVSAGATMTLTWNTNLPETNCDLILSLYERTQPPPEYTPQAEIKCTLQDPVLAVLRNLMPVVVVGMLVGAVFGMVKLIRR